MRYVRAGEAFKDSASVLRDTLREILLAAYTDFPPDFTPLYQRRARKIRANRVNGRRRR